MVRDAEGNNWLRLAESAERHDVTEGTVRVWVNRGHVRSWKLDNIRWVCDEDVADRERAWRRADWPA